MIHELFFTEEYWCDLLSAQTTSNLHTNTLTHYLLNLHENTPLAWVYET